MEAPSLQFIANPPRSYWTLPVSREETLAIREKFRKVGWRKPNHKPKTTKVIARAKKIWDRHCEHISVDPDQYLLESGPADFETWIDWILRTTKRTTYETISQLWKWLCQSYSILAKQPMDSFTTEQVRRYINGQMHEDHDVSRRARRKDTLSAEDLGILLQWYWKYGTSKFANERQRLQTSLLMLFSAFTGSRPGTLLADDDSGSDESTPQQISERVARGSNNGRESSADDLSCSTLVDDSDGDTLVGSGSELSVTPWSRIPSTGIVC